MIRKRIVGGILSVISAIWLSHCGNGKVTGSGNNAIQLSYLTVFPSAHIQYKIARDWSNEIEKRSKGQIKITMSTEVISGKTDTIYEEVLSGKTDIGMSCFTYSHERFPLLEGLDLPAGYPTGLAAGKIANILLKKYHPEEIANTHALYLHAHSPCIVASKNALHTLADIKGGKIRTTLSSQKIATRLGASPVVILYSGIYGALKQDTVQTVFCPMEAIVSLKLDELIRCVIDTSSLGLTTTMYTVMNKTRWESLPKDFQIIFTKTSDEWISKHGMAWDAADKEARETVKKSGIEIIPFSKEEQKKWLLTISPILDEYVLQTEEKGLPGEDFMKDMKKLAGEYQ